jgi:hypothetical protein
MDRLIVELLHDRGRCGGISLINAAGRKICGPFPVAARSSDNLAVANGNPQRDPLLRFGDTPAGRYMIRRIVKSGKGTKFPASRFGPHGLIVMEPGSGDAACADANGRFHFLIIGGDLSPGRKLRSTAGSLRLRNDHMRSLIKALAQRSNLHCEIVEVEHLPQRGAVHVDDLCRDDDPIDVPLWAASRSSERLHDVVFGSTAAALGLMTTLAIVPGSASAKPVVVAAAVSQDRASPVMPDAAHHSPYVRLAYLAPPAPAPVVISRPPSYYTLISAQDGALAYPSPQPGVKDTHCNLPVCGVAEKMNAPVGPLLDQNGYPLQANIIAQNLANPSSGYVAITAADAQNLADQGKLVIVVGPNQVSTVRPDNIPNVVAPTGNGPVIANVGANNVSLRLSDVFQGSDLSRVRFYTPTL